MLGYTVEEWLSTPNFWLTIVHPDDREEAGRVTGESFNSGKGSTQQFRWVPKDGSPVWVESNYEDVVRGLARQILEQAGYNVLEARGGEEAVHLSTEHSGAIELLLTDVVMPKASGKEIANLITSIRPDVRRAVYVGIHRRSDCASWSVGFECRIHTEAIHTDGVGKEGS